MCVPGAEISGFLRWSEVGPRDEKLMMSSALFAPVLVMPQPSVPVMRQFSPAPTVMMFLAVLGGCTVEVPGPLLPAANTMLISWLPALPLTASRTSWSCSCDSLLYVVPDVKLHELLEMRAPALYALARRTFVGWLNTPAPEFANTFELPTFTQGATPRP
jgi:hypothetical protein